MAFRQLDRWLRSFVSAINVRKAERRSGEDRRQLSDRRQEERVGDSINVRRHGDRRCH